ncbi:hypothetical protein TNIN_395331, partial [Trichonephila inaurata madagascariensis]
VCGWIIIHQFTSRVSPIQIGRPLNLKFSLIRRRLLGRLFDRSGLGERLLELLDAEGDLERFTLADGLRDLERFTLAAGDLERFALAAGFEIWNDLL